MSIDITINKLPITAIINGKSYEADFAEWEASYWRYPDANGLLQYEHTGDYIFWAQVKDKYISVKFKTDGLTCRREEGRLIYVVNGDVVDANGR